MSEWISVDDNLPDVTSGKFRVRRSNDLEMDAFFYADGISWIEFYGRKSCHWWDAKGQHERIEDVTQWK